MLRLFLFKNFLLYSFSAFLHVCSLSLSSFFLSSSLPFRFKLKNIQTRKMSNKKKHQNVTFVEVKILTISQSFYSYFGWVKQIKKTVQIFVQKKLIVLKSFISFMFKRVSQNDGKNWIHVNFTGSRCHWHYCKIVHKLH